MFYGDIGKHFNATRNAIVGIMTRARNRQDDIGKLARRSFALTGARSRGGSNGRIDRLPPHVVGRLKQTKRAAKTLQKNKPTGFALPPMNRAPREMQAKPPTMAKGPKPLTENPKNSKDIGYGECRAPVGPAVGADMLMCARPTVPGKSWCSDCMTFLFQPSIRKTK
jgi:hypothetical protein